MDINRQPVKKPFLKRYWPALAIAAVVVTGYFLVDRFGGGSYVVDHDKLAYGDVKRGDFSVQIRGVGTLVPKNIQWLATNVDGRVDHIAVDAGARVKAGDVILMLGNPKLKEQLAESHWELAAQRKEFRALEMEVAAELANVEASANDAKLNYRIVKLKLDAERQLVDQGIVSKLTFEQSKLLVEQHKERIKYQSDRVAKVTANLRALEEAHSARINKMQNTQNLIQQQIDDLSVRSRIDGVVQEMALKLGQQVAQGVQVAKVAPHDDLIALLDIQDFQVRDIALNQIVNIDTRSSKITGMVTRIDPAVTNGVVKVEVTLTGKLPPEARPDLSIEGVIDIERKRDAVYVDRPSFAQSFNKTTLYRLEPDGKRANRVNVEFGRASTRFIEVISGLKAGDRVIVSDSSAWESHNSILIR